MRQCGTQGNGGKNVAQLRVPGSWHSPVMAAERHGAHVLRFGTCCMRFETGKWAEESAGGVVAVVMVMVMAGWLAHHLCMWRG